MVKDENSMFGWNLEAIMVLLLSQHFVCPANVKQTPLLYLILNYFSLYTQKANIQVWGKRWGLSKYKSMQWVKIIAQTFYTHCFWFKKQKTQQYHSFSVGSLSSFSFTYFFLLSSHFINIYSTTKVTTAVSGMQLLEKGQIVLDTPLYEIIPEFKEMMISRKFPIGYMQTDIERKFAGFSIGKAPKIQSEGYKIAHVCNAGKNFNFSKINSIGKFCELYFPRGDYSDWNTMEQD